MTAHEHAHCRLSKSNREKKTCVSLPISFSMERKTGPSFLWTLFKGTVTVTSGGSRNF